MEARLDMSLTAYEYGAGVTPPASARPATVGYYQTFDYTYTLAGTTGGNAINDTFTRTVASGWGTASTGQPWTTFGGIASDYAVSGGLGQVTMSVAGGNGTRNTTMATVSLTDVDLSALVSTSQVATGPAGSLLGSSLVARSDGTGNNQYTARIVWGLSGAATLQVTKVVAGVETSLGSIALGTYIAGQLWNLRFTITGSTLQAVAWLNGTTQPSNYQLTVSDTALSGPGQVGTRTFQTAVTTNVNPVLSYDNFAVGNVFTDSIHALFFAPQRFGEEWVVSRVTVNNTSQGQVPTVYIMRGLVRPDSAFNLTSIRFPHQPPTLLATSQVVEFTPAGTNDVADLSSPIHLSPGEYFCVLFAGAKFPAPGATESSTVFVGGLTNR